MNNKKNQTLVISELWMRDFVHREVYFSLILFFYFNYFFVAVCGLSLVAASRGYSLLQCAGFSLPWLLLLRSMGSREEGFSSCGAQA